MDKLFLRGLVELYNDTVDDKDSAFDSPIYTLWEEEHKFDSEFYQSDYGDELDYSLEAELQGYLDWLEAHIRQIGTILTITVRMENYRLYIK